MDVTVLELAGVEATVGTFSVGPVDLTVDREILAVLGPSGCGKTTLLSAVAGIVPTSDGVVRLAGDDITDRPTEDRGTVFVFQDGALFPHLTARENVSYAATSPERVDQVTALLDVDGVLDRRPDALSGGERQRVALARSLAADPDCLLLDEPLSSLDVPIRRRLRVEIRAVLETLSVPAIYVTHDRNEASVVGDRLAVMREGELVQVGTPEEVFRRPESRFVASFTGNENLHRATVAEQGDARTLLEWGDRRVRAGTSGPGPGADAWFCVRPEYVTVRRGAAESRNEFRGTITEHRFEGERNRVSVELDGDAGPVVHAHVQPPTTVERGLTEGGRVTVGLPSDAVHVIPSDDLADR